MKKTFLILSLLAVASIATAQRFAMLSDIHITPGNKSEGKLREAVKEINAADLDFVILAGDLTNEGSDKELLNVKSILDSISHPLYIIPGNHETTWSQSAAKTFSDLWGTDRFVAEYDSLIIIGIGCGPYLKMGDGHVKTEDLAWLKSTLDERMKPGKRVLSINHYPLKSDLDNYAEYASALAHYPVIAHLGGHYHKWIQYTAGDEPGTLPGIMVRALDMGKGDYGYTLVDVGSDSLRVYNKPIAASPEKEFTLPVRTDYTPVCFTAPEWESPEGFEVTKVWSDPASVFTRLAFDNDNIYFGNSLGDIKAVSKTFPHNEVWSRPTGASVYSRPVVLPNDRIAFPTATGISIVNKDGNESLFIPSQEGPYVADGVISPAGWIQGGYKRLEMRDPVSGDVRWCYDSIFNYCQAAPAIDGNDLVFGAWDTNLRCLDLSTGSLRWVWNNGKDANQLGPGNVVPVIAADKIIIVAPDRYMTAVDRATGKTLWRDNSHRYRESLGHNADTTVAYAKTMDGELIAVDATSPDFNELWSVDMGLGYEHAPCIVLEHDGIVYAGSRRGIVTAVDPATHTVLWQLHLGNGEVNGFDIDDTTGDIYFSLINGTIFRVKRS